MDQPFLLHKYLGLFLLFAALVFFPTYLVWELYFRQPAAVETLEEQRMEGGLRIFAQFCVTCHGNLGEGFIGPALNRDDLRPPLDKEAKRLEIADFLYKTISRGRPGTPMPAWLKEEGGGLDSEQIRSLIEFIMAIPPRWAEVAALVPTPTPLPEGYPTPTPLPPELAGKQIVNTVCAACHGPDVTGARGPNLHNNKFVQSLDDQGLEDFIKAGRPGTDMPAWKGKFTEAEFDYIVLYLRTLQQ